MRSEVVSILLFWMLVAALISIRITVGPMEAYRTNAGKVDVIGGVELSRAAIGMSAPRRAT